MKSVPVATFNEREPAQQFCRLLDQAGIQAFIHDESKLERFWFMSEPLAAIHVEVAQPDFLKARHLIRDRGEFQPVLKEAVRCPECGSSRVEFPQITRKFLTPVVQVALMSLHLMPREYYCFDCHYAWPKANTLEPQRDILGWPVSSRLWHPEQTPARKRH